MKWLYRAVLCGVFVGASLACGGEGGAAGGAAPARAPRGGGGGEKPREEVCCALPDGNHWTDGLQECRSKGGKRQDDPALCGK